MNQPVCGLLHEKFQSLLVDGPPLFRKYCRDVRVELRRSEGQLERLYDLVENKVLTRIKRSYFSHLIDGLLKVIKFQVQVTGRILSWSCFSRPETPGSRTSKIFFWQSGIFIWSLLKTLPVSAVSLTGCIMRLVNIVGVQLAYHALVEFLIFIMQMTAL